MNELNISQYVQESTQQCQEQLQMSLAQGFQAGASHVHTVVSAILLLYLAQGALFLMAEYVVPRYSDREEEAWEMYQRLSRGFYTGRFLMVLVLFQKTVFTFVTTAGGAP